MSNENIPNNNAAGPPFNDPKHPGWYTAPESSAGTPYGGSAGNPYGSPYSGPGAGGFVPPARGLSIAALVLGIVGVLSAGLLLLPQILAVVFGHLALRREPAGRGLAIAALVMGYTVIVLGLGLLAILITFLASSPEFS